MTWVELLVQIKFEAEANASTDYDAFFLGVADETAVAAARRHNFSDFFVPNFELDLEVGDPFTPLPSDWLRMEDTGRIRFVPLGVVGSNEYFLTQANGRQQRQTNSRPCYYRIANRSLYIFPWENLLNAGDQVILNYYAKPESVAGMTDIPVAIEDLVRQNCIARYLRVKNSKRSADHSALAKDAFTNAVANNI